MKYNFDEVVSRYGTASAKYDGLAAMGMPATEHTIPLFLADMDLKTAQPIIDAMHKVADFGMWGYTIDLAEPKYAESVIHWMKKRHNCEVKAEEITYSNGTIEAINTIIKTFSNVGEGVILSRPVYGHFNDCIAKDCHRVIVDAHLIQEENGDWKMDFDAIEKACAVPANRIYILSSPHNPVGRVWTPDELRTLAAICKKYDVLLVSDEVHLDILRKGVVHYPITSVVEDMSNIIMLNAINKSFNLAGLSCTNVIIPCPALRARFKSAFGMRMPTPFAVYALIAAYNEGEEWLEQVNEYIDGNIDFALDFFAKEMPKVKVFRPEGTYALWVDFSAYGLTGDEVHNKIYKDADVMLQDGIVHDPVYGAQCQRICVPCARSVLGEALERIAKEFANL